MEGNQPKSAPEAWEEHSAKDYNRMILSVSLRHTVRQAIIRYGGGVLT